MIPDRLSERALIFNSEAVLVQTALSDLKSLDRAWTRLRSGSVVVDSALITAYDAVRAKNPPVPPPPVSPVTSVPSQILWDAVNSGACNPSSYEYLWVDSGYLSGGSGNQLELPRGANRYFGFHFTAYNLAQSVIGDVDLSVGSTLHPDRRLSWHGDNRMERINLPTGHSYSGTVILFRRRPGIIDLIWAASGSQRAIAWASASDAAAQRYNVGQTGSRKCGLF